ncbi:hypothetical protein B0J13DRAFT_522014 [Dactylonectria estremocensis]|uniref:Uncharacterized protein n=1 Tax=Dactylonectria estremocensis TaxID=1079267 RepID=A0A9P9EZD3_9HYPO|nr:hypothetical protein B0J13DRAFT_522014 [Dactylonectria estremocensis]
MDYFGHKLKVIGVGTVILPRKRRQTRLDRTPTTLSALRSALWPDEERRRFAALQTSRQSKVAATAAESLTPGEVEWLKKHYGSEFKFLQSHGLSIYKDEDREEGRAILRAIVFNDDDEAGEDEEDSDVFDPEQHSADDKFSQEGLDWIEAHYGNSTHSMLCYGLKVSRRGL